MVDFKKALVNSQYDEMRKQHPDMYEEIVAACSVLSEDPLSGKAEAERYCMSVAIRMYRRGWRNAMECSQ